MKRTFTFLLTALFLCVGMTMKAQTFPETSTAEAPKYYTIASYNRGGVLTDVGGALQHVAVAGGSYWYFTKANDNGGVYFCNSNGRYLTANQTVGDTPGVWYVLANGVNAEGVSISKTNPISNKSCLDASNAGAGVGTWAPSANDWHGTTWVFAEAEGIEKLSYTLTDELGNKYTGSYIGVAGTSEPTLSGAVGCTFSNVAWNGTTYTASIVFPFRVSDANTTKGVMISSFKNDANKFLWRAVGTNITGQKNVEADSENYHWAIYPAFNDGSFTFTIKNIGTGKYIYSTSDANSHNQGAVVLADEGSAFTLEANNKFKLSTGKFLSMNSTTTANEQYVGTWGDHGGTYNKFYDCPIKVTVESPWVGNIIENGNTYYLYNAKAKAFMKGANSWGTQASFGEDAVAFTAEGSGDTYGLRSTYNNYLGADLYVDQGKKDFVFTQVGDGIYTITKDGAYLAYIDNSVVKTVAEVTDGCYWQLLTKESILSDMTAATVSSPYGVTPLITGANFGRGDNANSAWSGGPAVGGDNANHCAEKWNAGVFTVSQELANLPSGTYKLQAQGFYRMGGVAEAAAARAAGTEVYDVKFIANDQSVTLMSVMDEAGKLNVGADYGSYGKAPNSMGDASQFFSNGYYEHELYFSVGDDGQAVIGVNHNEAIGNDWVIFDNFRLTYYGDLSLSDFNKQAFYVVKDQLDDLVNTCSSLSTLNAVFAAYSDVVDGAEAIANDEGATLAEIEAFIPVMEAMIAQVKAIDEYYNNVFVSSLESYNEILMKSTPNSQDVYAVFNDAISAASNVSSVTAIAELEAKVAAMENARKVYVLNAIPTDDSVFDYTFLLVNPDMETGNINGWTHTDGWQFQSNNEFKNGDAVINRKFQERWVWAAALGNVSTEQTVSDIPNGVYSVSASIIATRQDAADPKAAATGVYLFANTSKVAAATANNVPELFTVEVNVLNNVLTLGIKGENAEANWIAFDNVTLSYHGALPESVILQLQKEEFLAKWEEYKAYEPSLNGSWGAINNTYYKAVYDSADAMVKDLDAVTEKTVIEEMITKMSEAIASVEAAYVVGVEHSKLTAVLEDALANSIPLNASVLEAANDALQTAKNAGTSIATTEALEQAIEDLTTAYITYISNAVAKEGYAFDITCLVVNAEVTSAEGWTNAEGRIITNTTYEGAPDKAAFDVGWWAGVVDIHQVLPELPAGGYTLSAAARSASPESYIYAKNGDVEVKTTLPQDGDQNGQFGNGWGKVSTDTINVAAGESLTIGVHINNPGTNFAAADNFKLYYIPAYVKATKVVLNKAEVVLTAQGATEQLVATVEPANATFNTVTWKSSDDAVVVVDETGLLTAVANGTATITATTVDGVVATCQVTVAFAVAEVQLDKSEATLTAKDATLALNVTVLPEDAADKTVTWSTSDENVAIVDANGVVTAVANGKATITATAGGFSATCEVTVAIAVTEVSLDKSEATLTAKDATLALNVTVLPEDAADKTVTWSTSDENVATVDANGVVTAVANGKATITATAGGFSATCEVTVAIAVTEVKLDKSEATLTAKDATLELNVTVLPEYALDKTVTWSTSNAEVATVDANGVVTAVANGTATITATAGGFSATCEVTVAIAVTEVKLDKSEATLTAKDATLALNVTVLPEYALDKTVTWSTSNAEVATVDENGVVTAVANGTATITATAGGFSATCEVTVAIAVTEVKLDKSEATLTAKDATLALNVTVLPEYALDKTVTWTSSDEAVATVDANGVVTAVANGTATITATAGGFSATCEVTVAIAVTEVKLDKSEATLTAKDATLELNVTVLPEYALDKTVTWTSSDEAVATVDENGVVTAVANGTATITATAGGFSATCEVTVAIAVTGVTLDKEIATLTAAGATVELVATVAPETAADKTVVWSTSNAEVATVDENGVVTAVANGTATITATAGGFSATCEVTVAIKVEMITLNTTWGELTGLGATLQLIATVAPENAVDKTITWSSSTEAVTVDETGLVTVVAPYDGTVTITATAVNGVTATCMLTVTAMQVTLDKTEVELTAWGATVELVATVAPEDAWDTSVTWTSSDETIATVDSNGVVTALANGVVTITATAFDGAKAECVVTVKDIPDGIENVDNDADTVIYDLSGRRVTEMTEGIYIVNGKKVVIK